MKTLVVNFFGGQGCGKSSMASSVFSALKWQGIDCEICTEFAKELVWEARHDTFKDELYIFAKQNHRLFRCNGKVKVILTDRPLVMSIVYNDVYGSDANKDWNEAYNKLVLETFNNYNNLNILLKRIKPFNPNGRNETEEKALEFDEKFKKSLFDCGISHYELDGDESSVAYIVDIIKTTI